MIDKFFDDFVYNLFCTILVCVVVFGGSYLIKSCTMIEDAKDYLEDNYSAKDIDLGFKTGSFVSENKYYDVKWSDFSGKTLNIIAKDGTVKRVHL